jgi:3,4-dihydroxy 2-butanone 4-phosphate synthase/GTP cyclohydrolase II
MAGDGAVTREDTNTKLMPFASIPEAIEDFRRGKMLIVLDDERRENEGDLIIAAEHATPDAIAFMASQGRGLICAPITGERADELGLTPMAPANTERHGTAFLVSVDARHGTTTGISAHDRAATVKALIDSDTSPGDLLRPGHVFPLRARDGGVLVRAGQTEAGVDLARLARLYPAAVICEIMKDDGTMARLPDLEAFAREHGIKLVTVRDLIEYRRQHEKLVTRAASITLPTRFGEFTAHAYHSMVDDKPYLALTLGDVSEDGTLVRVHSSCLTGDVFHSLRCDCGAQVETALGMMQQEGRGVLLYIQQEGRDIGLLNKIRAYELQEHGSDTVEANRELGFPDDPREYGIGYQILADLGVRRMRILTNNPRKWVNIEAYGLEVIERVPLEVPPTPESLRYLRTKRDRLGHLLTIEDAQEEANGEDISRQAGR